MRLTAGGLAPPPPSCGAALRLLEDFVRAYPTANDRPA
jgi:hypothetical protein